MCEQRRKKSGSWGQKKVSLQYLHKYYIILLVNTVISILTSYLPVESYTYVTITQ